MRNIYKWVAAVLLSVTLSGCVKVLDVEVINDSSKDLYAYSIGGFGSGKKRYLGSVQPKSRQTFPSALREGSLRYHLVFTDVKGNDAYEVDVDSDAAKITDAIWRVRIPQEQTTPPLVAGKVVVGLVGNSSSR